MNKYKIIVIVHIIYGNILYLIAGYLIWLELGWNALLGITMFLITNNFMVSLKDTEYWKKYKKLKDNES